MARHQPITVISDQLYGTLALIYVDTNAAWLFHSIDGIIVFTVLLIEREVLITKPWTFKVILSAASVWASFKPWRRNVLLEDIIQFLFIVDAVTF